MNIKEKIIEEIRKIYDPDFTDTLTPKASFSALDIISLILSAALSLSLIICVIINLTPV